MPPVGFITEDGRKVKFAQALARPDLFTDYDHEELAYLATAAQREQYADVTVTQLVGPIQATILRERHNYYVYPEDVFEAAMGRWFHADVEVLRDPKDKTAIIETPMFLQVDGVRVGGTPDKLCCDKARKRDILVSRRVRRVFWLRRIARGEETLASERAQESMYAHLARHGKFSDGKLVRRDPKGAVVKFCVRDWVKREFLDAREKGEYYPPPFPRVELDLLPDDDARDLLGQRVALWKEGRKLPDEELPECNVIETWRTVRCKYHCPVASVCSQFQAVGNARAF